LNLYHSKEEQSKTCTFLQIQNRQAGDRVDGGVGSVPGFLVSAVGCSLEFYNTSLSNKKGISVVPIGSVPIAPNNCQEDQLLPDPNHLNNILMQIYNMKPMLRRPGRGFVAAFFSMISPKLFEDSQGLIMTTWNSYYNSSDSQLCSDEKMQRNPGDNNLFGRILRLASNNGEAKRDTNSFCSEKTSQNRNFKRGIIIVSESKLTLYKPVVKLFQSPLVMQVITFFIAAVLIVFWRKLFGSSGRKLNKVRNVANSMKRQVNESFRM
jgi:hypothetical protein